MRLTVAALSWVAWAIDQLEPDDASQLRDVLKQLAALPPPEAQLVGAQDLQPSRHHRCQAAREGADRARRELTWDGSAARHLELYRKLA